MEAAGQEKEMEFPSSLSYTSGRRLECFPVILAAVVCSENRQRGLLRPRQ